MFNMFSRFRVGPYTDTHLDSWHSLKFFNEALDQKCKNHSISHNHFVNKSLRRKLPYYHMHIRQIHMQLSEMFRRLVMARERSKLQNNSHPTDVGWQKGVFHLCIRLQSDFVWSITVHDIQLLHIKVSTTFQFVSYIDIFVQATILIKYHQ